MCQIANSGRKSGARLQVTQRPQKWSQICPPFVFRRFGTLWLHKVLSKFPFIKRGRNPRQRSVFRLEVILMSYSISPQSDGTKRVYRLDVLGQGERSAPSQFLTGPKLDWLQTRSTGQNYAPTYAASPSRDATATIAVPSVCQEGFHRARFLSCCLAIDATFVGNMEGTSVRQDSGALPSPGISSLLPLVVTPAPPPGTGGENRLQTL